MANKEIVNSAEEKIRKGAVRCCRFQQPIPLAFLTSNSCLMLTELYFLIAKYLSNGPCQRAAQVSRELKRICCENF